MEVMIFVFSIGFIAGLVAAGVGTELYDRRNDNTGLYYNEEQNIFYFKD